MLYPYNKDFGQKIKTDVIDFPNDMAWVSCYNSGGNVAAASANGVHAARTCPAINVVASAVVKAASAVTDILTISSTKLLGEVSNALSVLLTTAADDNLAVTKTDATSTINIALAKTSAAKNTASLIQAAIRSLSTVGGISVAGITCAAGGNWDTAAIATGETGSVDFSGGITTSDILTTGITNPVVPRNITATAGGTPGDIGAIAVIITGTNMADEVITETLPAFTIDTAGIVTGNKAFKTVTSIEIPAHDGLGATTAIGWGSKLGLPDKLGFDSILFATLNGTKEGTNPTVAVSPTALESNTMTLNSSLNNKPVKAWYIVNE